MSNYTTLKIDKSMYNAGKSFSAVLEKMDPSEQYAGTELEGSDAFQRQLKRFDIKVSGPNSDKVEKFFQTSDSAVLFPEYVSRAVRQGMEEHCIIEDLTAVKTIINGLDYRTMEPSLSDEDKMLNNVAEGAAIPQIDLKISDKLVKLRKYGKMLVASYEAIRYQRIDLFTVALKQIGAYIIRSQVDDFMKFVDEGKNGGLYETVSADGEYTFANLWQFMTRFKNYNMNLLVCSPATMGEILEIEEVKKCAVNAQFPFSGKQFTLLGAKIVVSDKLDDGVIMGIDSNYAFEYVQSGEVSTEYDKLIDRQLERAAVTVTAGFNNIFKDAVKFLSKN